MEQDSWISMDMNNHEHKFVVIIELLLDKIKNKLKDVPMCI